MPLSLHLLANEKVHGTVGDVCSNQEIDHVVNVCHNAVDLREDISQLPGFEGDLSTLRISSPMASFLQFMPGPPIMMLSMTVP